MDDHYFSFTYAKALTFITCLCFCLVYCQNIQATAYDRTISMCECDGTRQTGDQNNLPFLALCPPPPCSRTPS